MNNKFNRGLLLQSRQIIKGLKIMRNKLEIKGVLIRIDRFVRNKLIGSYKTKKFFPLPLLLNNKKFLKNVRVSLIVTNSSTYNNK